MDFSKTFNLIQTVAGLKLLISLFLNYPISLVYQIFFIKSSINTKCAYFIFTGIIISYFNYGNDTIHLLITILIVYSCLKLYSGNIFTNTFNFLFTLSYLSIGYFYTQTHVYGFYWTIPHCVLTLRLIAISFNLFDGNRCKLKDGKLCKHKDHFVEVPNFMEFFAHCLYPGSFMVGPQYDFYIFRDFVRRNQKTYTIVWKESLVKFCIGVFYFSIYMIGAQKIKPDLLTTKEFLDSTIFYQMTLIAILSKLHLQKYIFVWLFTDANLILSGLTHDQNYKLNNIDILKYETTNKFQGIIQSFNIQTNNWTSKYIYKRLKFMNSKTISHFTSLMFLAIWHGHKPGYYVTFLMEFVTVVNEKEAILIFQELESKFPNFKSFARSTIIDSLIYFILKINLFYFLGYSFMPFILLANFRYQPVLQSTYYLLFIQAIIIFISNKLIRILFLKKPSDKKIN